MHLYAFDKGATWEAGKLMLDGTNITNDKLFPTMAMEYMPKAFSIIFIIALISALFPSADGAITALTSSFCIDIIGMKRRPDLTEAAQKKMRQKVHLTFAAIFLLWLVVIRPQDWPEHPRAWLALPAWLALAGRAAVQLVLVSACFVFGRAFGHVTGFEPVFGVGMPLALSFIAVPLARMGL